VLRNEPPSGSTHYSGRPGRESKGAVAAAGIAKHVGCHTFGHSFATHPPESGYDYTNVLNKGGRGVTRPMDAL
jgi:integrase